MTKHNHLTYAMHDIKKYVKFSQEELKQFLYVLFAGAFVWTFNKWGIVYFDLERGLANLILAIIFMGIFFYGQLWIKKYVAVKLGYNTKYEWSMPGLIAMIVVAFLSYGYIPFILMGHTKLIQEDRKRLGKGHRFAFNHIDYFKICMLGYLFNYAIILIILAPIFLSTNSHFVMMLIKINLALIFFSILPLPKNDGLALFFSSRNMYYVIVVFIIIMSLLILLFHLFGFILALIISLIAARVIFIYLKI